MKALLAQAAQTAANTQADDTYVMWGFLLMAAALGLLILEVFVPSGGLIGALCGIAAIGSIISFFKYDAMWGTVALSLYILLTPIVIIFVFKIWLNSPVARWMILGGHDEDDASVEASIASEHARSKRMAELKQLVGTRGVAVTALRPVGKIKIEGRRIDAMAESGIIETGTPVVVVDVYDNQIKVRAI